MGAEERRKLRLRKGDVSYEDRNPALDDILGSPTDDVKTKHKVNVSSLRHKLEKACPATPITRSTPPDQVLPLLQQQGFRHPILVSAKKHGGGDQCRSALGISLPMDIMNPAGMAETVGPDHQVPTMDVYTQDSGPKMTLKQLADYYNAPSDQRKRLINVVSFSLADTPLIESITAPLPARILDLVSSVWPEEDEPRPETLLYALFGPQGAYTDWHVDMGGSSVWYHVITGSKTFLLAPPNPPNLSAFETWSSSEKQASHFLGDDLTDCQRVVLRPGDTLFLPSNWPHAVSTPQDSFVVGGNFLHGLDFEGIGDACRREERLGVQPKFQFPLLRRLMWHAADSLLERMQYNEESVTRWEVQGVPALVGLLKYWLKGGRGCRPRDVPTEHMSQTPKQLLQKLEKKAKQLAALITSTTTLEGNKGNFKGARDNQDGSSLIGGLDGEEESESDGEDVDVGSFLDPIERSHLPQGDDGGYKNGNGKRRYTFNDHDLNELYQSQIQTTDDDKLPVDSVGSPGIGGVRSVRVPVRAGVQKEGLKRLQAAKASREQKRQRAAGPTSPSFGLLERETEGRLHGDGGGEMNRSSQQRQQQRQLHVIHSDDDDDVVVLVEDEEESSEEYSAEESDTDADGFRSGGRKQIAGRSQARNRPRDGTTTTTLPSSSKRSRPGSVSGMKTRNPSSITKKRAGSGGKKKETQEGKGMETVRHLPQGIEVYVPGSRKERRSLLPPGSGQMDDGLSPRGLDGPSIPHRTAANVSSGDAVDVVDPEQEAARKQAVKLVKEMQALQQEVHREEALLAKVRSGSVALKDGGSKLAEKLDTKRTQLDLKSNLVHGRWFIYTDQESGTQQGPFTAAQLNPLIKAQLLDPEQEVVGQGGEVLTAAAATEQPPPLTALILKEMQEQKEEEEKKAVAEALKKQQEHKEQLEKQQQKLEKQQLRHTKGGSDHHRDASWKGEKRPKPWQQQQQQQQGYMSSTSPAVWNFEDDAAAVSGGYDVSNEGMVPLWCFKNPVSKELEGPYSVEELRDLFHKGEIPASILVHNDEDNISIKLHALLGYNSLEGLNLTANTPAVPQQPSTAAAGALEGGLPLQPPGDQGQRQSRWDRSDTTEAPPGGGYTSYGYSGEGGNELPPLPPLPDDGSSFGYGMQQGGSYEAMLPPLPLMAPNGGQQHLPPLPQQGQQYPTTMPYNQPGSVPAPRPMISIAAGPSAGYQYQPPLPPYQGQGPPVPYGMEYSNLAPPGVPPYEQQQHQPQYQPQFYPPPGGEFNPAIPNYDPYAPPPQAQPLPYQPPGQYYPPQYPPPDQYQPPASALYPSHREGDPYGTAGYEGGYPNQPPAGPSRYDERDRDRERGGGGRYDDRDRDRDYDRDDCRRGRKSGGGGYRGDRDRDRGYYKGGRGGGARRR